ncbi:MAG: TetR family transcriptional [Geobacteraceae bacterium]|nr:MAG: TetR family transcriptional [Geobacteraceae bacterium]
MNKRSGEESKRNIIAAAIQVFADYGYDNASMRMIAQAAGVSVGTLYLHFKNKDDLYLTITKEWIDDLNELTNRALDRIDDPRTAITVFITISIDYTREHREMILLQGRKFGRCLGLEQKQQFFRKRRQLLTDIVQRGVTEGVFRSDDPAETARIIFNVLRGFIFSMLIDEEALFRAEACVDLVLNGLRRRNNG